MKIRITGFEAFSGRIQNCSELVCQKLKAMTSQMIQEKIEYEFINLPVSFKNCWTTYLNQNSDTIDFVFALGEAATSEEIRLEKVGLNLIDSNLPDNDGDIFLNKPIFDDFQNALFTSVDIRATLDQIENADPMPPVNLSLSAGTYVCNYFYFNLLAHYISTNTKVLFIHLPLCIEQDEKQRYSADILAQRVLEIIKTVSRLKNHA